MGKVISASWLQLLSPAKLCWSEVPGLFLHISFYTVIGLLWCLQKILRIWIIRVILIVVDRHRAVSWKVNRSCISPRCFAFPFKQYINTQSVGSLGTFLQKLRTNLMLTSCCTDKYWLRWPKINCVNLFKHSHCIFWLPLNTSASFDMKNTLEHISLLSCRSKDLWSSWKKWCCCTYIHYCGKYYANCIMWHSAKTRFPKLSSSCNCFIPNPGVLSLPRA